MLKTTNSSQSFVDLFNEAFKGREDVYPIYWEYTDYKTGKEKDGYSPVCENFKHVELCLKSSDHKAKCKDCQNHSYALLTDDILNEHFEGKIFLGVYPLLKDNTCWFIAGDFDKHDDGQACDPLADVKSFYEVCEVNEIPCYVLRSRSGNGFHSYIFFDKSVPAWKARLVVFEMLKEAQIIGDDTELSSLEDSSFDRSSLELSSFDRLFPHQDTLNDDTSLGNLIGLPFQGKAAANGNTVFLDPSTDFEKPFENQTDVLTSIQRITEDDLDRLIEEWNLERETAPAKANYKFSFDSSKNDQFQKLLQCGFIKWAYENQADVTEPLWFDMVSNVSRISPGGVDFCHSCSKDYPGYSRPETDSKILNAMNGSPPHTCDEIKKNGFTCKQSCDVKSPVGLINKKFSQKKRLNNIDANVSMEKIVEVVKSSKAGAALTILKNPEYIGSLALAAENDLASYETTLLELKNHGLRKTDVDSIKRIVKAQRKMHNGLRLATSEDSPEPLKVKQVISDAPVQDDIVIPLGWELSHQSGLEKVNWKNDNRDNSFQNRVQVSSTPILITGRMVNALSGTEVVKLAWYRDGKWKQHIADRKLIATAKTITDLADVGVPVTSSTAKDLVEFLYAFEAANIDNLPKAKVSDFLGWQNDKIGFLLGDKLFKGAGPEERSIDLSETPPDEWKEDSIAFRPADEGNQQIAKSFCSKGTYEAWVKAINPLFNFPKVIAAVYFSLTAPFLEILGAPNFTVDWSYPTSTGKTTVLRVAGSCWGNPDEKATTSVVNSWDNTKVGIERTATMLNGLPLLLDDTKLAGTGSNKNWASGLVSHIIYLIAMGKGRGRGSSSGLRNRGSWRTILLSTGEQSAIEFTQDGGSRARVISLWGAPFGAVDNATGQLVNRVNFEMKHNFGHAGPRLIKFLFDHKDEWKVWQDAYMQNQREFAEKAGANEVAIRISDYFATLATAIPLIHMALPELRSDPSVKDIIVNIWNAAISEVSNADRATVALQFVYNWAVSNQAKFYDKNQNTDASYQEPYGGWSGVWEADNDNWSFIGFNTTSIKDLLKEQGFDADPILRIWKQRDWIETKAKGNGMGHQHRIRKQQIYCYRITRKGISEALEDEGLEQKDSVSDFASKISDKIMSMLPADITSETLNALEMDMHDTLSRYKKGFLPFPISDQQQELSAAFGDVSPLFNDSIQYSDYQNH